MRSSWHPYHRLLAWSPFLVVVGSAIVTDARAYTAKEIALLPTYCQDRLAEPPKNWEHWQKFFGPEWTHMHHYCYGLGYLVQAKTTRQSDQDRRYTLDRAKGEVGYMFKAMKDVDKHLIAPELYIANGEIASLQGDAIEAERYYRKAADIRPDYPKSWLALADLYRQQGRREQERDVLTRALRAAPDKYKEYLRKRLAEVDSNADSAQGSPGGSSAKAK